jgi:hypothetical protein
MRGGGGTKPSPVPTFGSGLRYITNRREHHRISAFGGRYLDDRLDLKRFESGEQHFVQKSIHASVTPIAVFQQLVVESCVYSHGHVHPAAIRLVADSQPAPSLRDRQQRAAEPPRNVSVKKCAHR